METILHSLVSLFTEPHIIRALIAAVTAGVVCSLVGSFVVLRGMAFFGDALAHAILPGVALGYILSGGHGPVTFACALIAAAAIAVGIGAISSRAKMKEDTAIGVVFAGMFALGIALMSGSHDHAHQLEEILFGDVLGVTQIDVILVVVFGGLVALTLIALFKEFVVITFDATLATTLRLPAKRLYYLLLVLIAVTVVVSLQTVGAAMMLAMLVTPAAAAQLLTRRLPVMVGLAAGIGAGSSVVGLVVSDVSGIASGATIVLVCTAVFLLALVFKKRA